MGSYYLFVHSRKILHEIKGTDRKHGTDLWYLSCAYDATEGIDNLMILFIKVDI